MVTKQQYEEWQATQERADLLKLEILAHARVIAVALFGQNFLEVCFTEKSVLCFDQDSWVASFKIELLFDHAWEAVVADMKANSAAYRAKQAQKEAEREKREQETREKEELSRLLKKYPDTAGQAKAP